MAAIERNTLLLAIAAAAVGACGSNDTPPPPDSGTINGDAGGGEPPAERPATDTVAKESPDYPGRSFYGDVYGIFNDKTKTFGCAGATCHLASVPGEMVVHGGDLHMDTPVAACSDLVNVDVKEAPGKKRVVPGSLADSYLWCKLTTTTCGTREPRGASHNPLEPFYSDVIKSWIENGAHCW